MAYNPQDFYFRKAKQENYLARSIYKLEEIDQQVKLLQRGWHVLDLGAAPGSWSQYACQKVGQDGRVLGVDLTPIDLREPNGVFLVGDVFAIDLPALAQQHGLRLPLDAIISDMAPKTTGVFVTDQARSYNLCAMALELADQHLRRGGNFVCKFFDGPDFQEFRKMMQERFASVKIVKPKSTRSASKELFFVGLGKKTAA